LQCLATIQFGIAWGDHLYVTRIRTPSFYATPDDIAQPHPFNEDGVATVLGSVVQIEVPDNILSEPPALGFYDETDQAVINQSGAAFMIEQDASTQHPRLMEGMVPRFVAVAGGCSKTIKLLWLTSLALSQPFVYEARYARLNTASRVEHQLGYFVTPYTVIDQRLGGVDAGNFERAVVVYRIATAFHTNNPHRDDDESLSPADRQRASLSLVAIRIMYTVPNSRRAARQN
jgi:hypothetical protein